MKELLCEDIGALSQMRRVTNTNLTKSLGLAEPFLQGNVSLRHLLNAKLPLMSSRRSAFNEVNDWALYYSLKLKKISYFDFFYDLHFFHYFVSPSPLPAAKFSILNLSGKIQKGLGRPATLITVHIRTTRIFA